MRVAGGIAGSGGAICLAGSEIAGRDGLLLLQMQGGLDHGGRQAGLDVPLDVAVEEEDAGVIGFEAQHDVALLGDLHGVPAHGDASGGGVVDRGAVGAGCFVGKHAGSGASDHLELVAVQVKGVATVVEVIEADLHDGIVPEDIWVAIDAVDDGVGGIGAGGEGRVEGGHDLADIGNIVHGSPVLAVNRLEEKVDADDLIRRRQEGFLVIGNEVEIVISVEGLDDRLGWERGIVVIDKMAGDIRLQVIGDGWIEHVEVEAGQESVILVRSMFCGEKDTISLSCRNIDTVDGLLLSIDAIDFNNCQLVLIELEIRSSEGAHVDNANEVRLSRLDVQFNILSFVEQV